jgi:threonine dehydratase
VGGGGLISGIGATVKARWPEARVIGCAATNTKVMMESVAAGRQLDLPSLPSLSDGTAGGIEQGSITFELCQTLVDQWIEITEEAIGKALIDYLTNHHQLIEGSAAMAIAAWDELVQRGQALGTTVIVSCGANIDPAW